MRKDFSVWELAKRNISNEASTFILNTIKDDRKVHGNRKILYVCIGTPRLNGDSFGPMVGNILSKHLKDIPGCNSEVIGTVKDPVHAVNLENYRDKITSGDYFVVGIDASVTKEPFNFITLKQGNFEPGLATDNCNKNNPLKVGDICCLYNISVESFARNSIVESLQNVSLTELEDKAVFITQAIINTELALAKERETNTHSEGRKV